MMPLKNQLQYQIDFQYWANESLFASLDKLSDEARKRDEALPYKSIHATLVQMLALNILWQGRIDGDAPSKPFDRSFFDEWRELKQALRMSMRQLQHDLQAKPATFFEGQLTYSLTVERETSNWVRDVLAHYCAETTHFRGMIVAVSTRLGAPLPDLDYLNYRREMQDSLHHVRGGD